MNNIIKDLIKNKDKYQYTDIRNLICFILRLDPYEAFIINTGIHTYRLEDYTVEVVTPYNEDYPEIIRIKENKTGKIRLEVDGCAVQYDKHLITYLNSIIEIKTTDGEQYDIVGYGYEQNYLVYYLLLNKVKEIKKDAYYFTDDKDEISDIAQQIVVYLNDIQRAKICVEFEDFKKKQYTIKDFIFRLIERLQAGYIDDIFSIYSVDKLNPYFGYEYLNYNKFSFMGKDQRKVYLTAVVEHITRHKKGRKILGLPLNKVASIELKLW